MATGFFPMPPRQSKAAKAIQTFHLAYPFTVQELKKKMYGALVKNITRP